MRRIRGCGKDGSGNHSFAGGTIISSLWKICLWSIEHNHYLPVKSSRVQPQLFSPTLYSLTLWLISDPSPGLSSLLSEPLLSHLLVDLQPLSARSMQTLLSDDPRATSSPMIHHEITTTLARTLPLRYLCITCTYCPRIRKKPHHHHHHTQTYRPGIDPWGTVVYRGNFLQG